MSALTLPGDIDGLLRRGSPVVLAADEHWNGTSWMDPIEHGTKGLLFRPDDEPLWWVAWESPTGDPYCLDPAAAKHLALDLSDATGRAHAAWWLADRYGVARHSGVTWTYRGLWDLDGDRRRINFGTAHPGRSQLPVPSISALDPNDSRTLKDGSRWVDAEALRLVVLHVAGRSS